ncbi:MAG TPA: ROK family protein [Thermoanaerobaculia bacterium]|nr:ROK family protein [Thermoanaerobaculia bacterium]
MRIGVDLGGTKTEALALGADGRELLRLRRPTPPDYDGTLATIASLVAEVESALGTRGSVGVGMPGTISPATGLVKNANSTWLLGRPLGEDLGRLLGRDVRLANDANCFALSEASDGAAAGAACVFGVIVGTGTGGGIVLNGRVLTGPNAIAGEWGHNPLPWPGPHEQPGPSCWCGKNGCIETFLSGPGLARDHLAATGEARSADEIAMAAEEGAPLATATLARYTGRMARALASVINVLDPNVIVLGGGLSNVARLYSEVPRLWQTWAFSDRVDTRLVPPRWGDASGVRGAAWLWSEDEAQPAGA